MAKRLLLAVLIVLALIMILIILAAFFGSSTGSGIISFGTSESQDLKLSGESRLLSVSHGQFNFVADLKSQANARSVRVEFQTLTSKPPAIVWKFRASFDKPNYNILGGGYKWKFLRTKNITAPGRYRMVILSSKTGEALARGSFSLIR